MLFDQIKKLQFKVDSVSLFSWLRFAKCYIKRRLPYRETLLVSCSDFLYLLIINIININPSHKQFVASPLTSKKWNLEGSSLGYGHITILAPFVNCKLVHLWFFECNANNLFTALIGRIRGDENYKCKRTSFIRLTGSISFFGLNTICET